MFLIKLQLFCLLSASCLVYRFWLCGCLPDQVTPHSVTDQSGPPAAHVSGRDHCVLKDRLLQPISMSVQSERLKPFVPDEEL